METADTKNAQDAIRRLSERWTKAMATADIAALLDMVTDDVVFAGAGTPPLRGRAHVEGLYRTFFSQFVSIAQEPVIEEIAVAGEWAFVWGRETLRLRHAQGEPGIVLAGCGLSVVWRGEDGAWRFARAINTLAPQSPQTPEALQ